MFSLIDQPCKTLGSAWKITAMSINDTTHPSPPPRPSVTPPVPVLPNEHTVVLVWSSLLLSHPANQSLGHFSSGKCNAFIYMVTIPAWVTLVPSVITSMCVDVFDRFQDLAPDPLSQALGVGLGIGAVNKHLGLGDRPGLKNARFNWPP